MATKLLFDNRVILSLFLALTFVNAYAIQHHWYA